jgi:hypothetical protein
VKCRARRFSLFFGPAIAFSEENWSQNGKKTSGTTIPSDQNGIFGLQVVNAAGSPP